MPATAVADHALPLARSARPGLTGGRRVGVLLSHGFTGSVASVRPWAEHLAAQGYGVLAPRLPGHGTSWQDLDRCGWSDWYGEVERALEELEREHDVVAVGGLSMGGTLALRLAAEQPQRVAGVMVVNPAVASARLDLKVLPLLARVRSSVPGVADDIKKAGVSEHGYDRTPLHALLSFVRSWPGTVAALPRLSAPLLYLRSREDHVVDDRSQPVVLGAVSSTEVTEVSLPDSYHVATLDHDAPTIFAESTRFLARLGA